ncbi:hypothetical protein Enr13x_21400 [Stieleria neptunia]|uniref:Sulfotransferase domain protein n=1 Tax=Stieleria neptunia TaxID=2527979 RepID=A0A518HN60_9BACT|nr:sulfotransferase [Stieleria neptunia]QDV42295.1 hypothetical protein Enr13x_21400 [Stieleria neptunia]
MKEYRYTPVILVGALRSGTKLVRDSIGAHPDVDLIPHEVDHIWQTNQTAIASDELSATALTQRTRQAIHKKFDRYHRGAPVLIEKTVSNCLRLPFVDSVFPNAKYIHLTRDGIDTIESIYRQWTMPPDWRHFAKKLLSYPWWKDPQALSLSKQVASRVVSRLLGFNERRAGTWGVRYAGIDHDVQTREILEVCAAQWSRSTTMATQALQAIPNERQIAIEYESFVEKPLDELERFACFLDIDRDWYRQHFATNRISRSNVGIGRQRLTTQQLQMIEPYLQGCPNECPKLVQPA